MATLHLLDATDLAHPGLEPFRTLRRQRDLERRAQFVAEGEAVVLRLLASPYPVTSMLTTPARLERLRAALDARPDTIEVFLAPDDDGVRRVSGFVSAPVKAFGHVPRPPTLDDLLRDAPRPRLLVVLDGLASAENVGVVVRNAAGLGAHGIVVGATSCSPFLTRAIRTSMGTVFRTPVVEPVDLVAALDRLRAAGVTCVAAHPAPGARPVETVDLRGDVCVVFGAEGDGISAAVLAACDVAAALPMAGDVDSLNVGSASAAMLYEVGRQRRAAPPPVTGPLPGRGVDSPPPGDVAPPESWSLSQ